MEATDKKADVFKKGQVTFSTTGPKGQTAHFNDEWARGLKDGPIEKGGEEFTAEEKFVAEYEDHLFQELSKEDRTALLKKAFAACLAAQ